MEFKVKIDLEKTIEAKDKKQALKRFWKAVESYSAEQITPVGENQVPEYVK